MLKFILPNRPLQRGFSYAEVLLAIMLIAILLVPALQALSTGISGGANNQAARQLNLRSKMEEVLSKPFDTLDAAAIANGNSSTKISASFPDTPPCTAECRVVVLYRFDAGTNALSSNDTGLLYVSVYYETEDSASALNTLVGRWPWW